MRRPWPSRAQIGSGEGFEQLRDRVDVTAQLLMIGGKRGKLALCFGQVLDAQDRPPADRAALGQHVALLQGGERERKAFALGAQRIDRFVHPERLFRAEPAPERKHAARQRRSQQDRYIPRDVGCVGAGGPDHDHLRFGEQQRAGTVALLAQLVDLGLAGGNLARGACARAQQRDGGGDPEHNDPKRERQGREFVPLERHEGIEVIRDRM